MKQGDTVFVSATATGLGKDKKAVIDKIENVMGTTFVTVTYTHPDAVSGLGGCFVASHIIETDSREKPYPAGSGGQMGCSYRQR